MQRLAVVTRRYFSIAGSNWIYASKYEQILSQVSKGRLKILPEARDINDVTIRMHSALAESDVVLCEDFDRATNLLYSLTNKLRHIEPLPRSRDIVKVQDTPEKKASDELLQLSEHLKFKKEYARTAGHPLDVTSVANEQNYIRLHNTKQAFREKIASHR